MYEVRADAFLSRIVDLMLGCIYSPILKNTKHIYHVVDQKQGGGGGLIRGITDLSENLEHLFFIQFMFQTSETSRLYSASFQLTLLSLLC